MERKTEVLAVRLDDDFVEIKTITTEKVSNVEFCRFWANLTMQKENTRLSLQQGEHGLEMLRKKLEIEICQIKEFEHLNQDCTARAGKVTSNG